MKHGRKAFAWINMQQIDISIIPQSESIKCNYLPRAQIEAPMFPTPASNPSLQAPVHNAKWYLFSNPLTCVCGGQHWLSGNCKAQMMSSLLHFVALWWLLLFPRYARSKYEIRSVDVDMSICSSIWNMRISWSLRYFSLLCWFSASNFILFSSNCIHLSSASLLLWAKDFVMISITASTIVLLPFFCCCCLDGPCCSGPVAKVSSCSVGAVLLLGVDPCCWPLVSVLLSKLPVA